MIKTFQRKPLASGQGQCDIDIVYTWIESINFNNPQVGTMCNR